MQTNPIESFITEVFIPTSRPFLLVQVTHPEVVSVQPRVFRQSMTRTEQTTQPV